MKLNFNMIQSLKDHQFFSTTTTTTTKNNKNTTTTGMNWFKEGKKTRGTCPEGQNKHTYDEHAQHNNIFTNTTGEHKSRLKCTENLTIKHTTVYKVQKALAKEN